MKKLLFLFASLALIGVGCSQLIDNEIEHQTNYRSMLPDHNDRPPEFTQTHGESNVVFAFRAGQEVYGGQLGKSMHDLIQTQGELMDENKAFLALYAVDQMDPAQSFVGYVLALHPNTAYQLYPLEPVTNEMPTFVESVFFMDVAGDEQKEILVLYSTMTGIGPTGAQPYYETAVYTFETKPDGSKKYVRLPEIESELVELYPAEVVQAKLAK